MNFCFEKFVGETGGDGVVSNGENGRKRGKIAAPISGGAQLSKRPTELT